MDKIKDILLPIDFSSVTDILTRKAAFLSKTFDAKIILVHAIEHHPSPTHPFPDAAEKELQQEIHAHLESQADKLRELGAQVAEDVICKYGKAVKVIQEAALEAEVGIILIGVRHKSGLARFLGGTAEKIARKSEVPTLLIHPDDPEESFRKMICAYDFSAHAHNALKVALHITANTDAQLTVTNVCEKTTIATSYPNLPIEGPVVPFGVYADDYIEWENPSNEEESKALIAHRRGMIRRDIDKLNTFASQADLEVREGYPVDQLMTAIREHSADLLILGATGHNRFMRFLLGSTSENILRKAPCSILVIKDHDIFTSSDDTL